MASRVMMPMPPTSNIHSLSNSIPHLRDHQVTGSLDQLVTITGASVAGQGLSEYRLGREWGQRKQQQP